MRVVLLEGLGVSGSFIDDQRHALAKRGHELIVFERDDDASVIAQRLQGAEAAILANMPLAASVVEGAQDLRFIDVAFTGVDHIPLDVCKKRGIAVSNASGYATQAVAELCIGFMIDLLRSVPQAQERCRSCRTKAGLELSLLQGKTVGIIGAGAIGTRVAELAHAFGCRTLAFNRSAVGDEAFDAQVTLPELLAQSDIVSLHVPLTAETRGMIAAGELAQMKTSACLINTARGPIVDQDALAAALADGVIAGAACDVFDAEPPLPAGCPLLHAPNIIVTPHMAFDTVQSMELRAKITFDNLYAWLDGHQENVVLP